MAPPSFSDLGKDASDLYNKDFTFGSVKAELKTKSSGSGTELKTCGSHDLETARLAADLEAKHAFPDYGITVTQKWKTSNVVTAEVAIEDKLAKGLKNAFEATVEPNTGKRSAKVKTVFKRPSVNSGLDLEFKSNFPTVLSNTVLGYRNFYVGTSAAFDTERNKLTKLNYGAAYQVKDFAVHASVDNGSTFGASVFHRVGPSLEVAARASWSSAAQSADLGAAAKYRLADGSSWAKLRLDNRAALGSAYSFLVRDGFRVTMSASLDLKNLNGGGHQLGLALNFEP